MIKVIIIDDDYLVRLNLKMLIDWESYGLTIVGEAENGKEGLVLIKDLKPDFAIIDIKMPIMDGIVLTEIIREENIQLHYIMLSNYDEFEYVRCAMKNGASDFLLKHKLNKESLTQQMKAVVEKLAIDQRQAQHVSTGNSEKAMEEFIMKVLVGELTHRTQMAEYLEKRDLTMGVTNILPVIMVIDDYDMNVQVKGVDYGLKLRKNIGLLLNEFINERDKLLFTQVEDNKYLILISFDHERSQADIYQGKYHILSGIRGQIKSYYNESVTFSLGDMVNIDELKSSYMKAYQRLGSKFYIGKGKDIDGTNSLALEAVAKEEVLSDEMIKALQEELQSLNISGIETILRTIFANMRSHRMNRASVLEVMNYMTGMIEKTAQYMQVSSQLLYREGSPKTTFRLMETEKDFRRWFKIVIEQLQVQMNQDMMEYSDNIRKVITYVREHYRENISLSLIADYIGINSSYLSKLFKDEVGSGFNQYVCQQRLIHAKELIDKGGSDFKEIALACGFNEYSYFSKVFKKNIGVTPKQYLSKRRS